MNPNKQSHHLFNSQKRKTLGTLGALAVSPLIGCGGGNGSSSTSSNVNYVYTQTNATNNEIVRFRINSQGTISYVDSVATGGAGSAGISPESNGAPGADPLISQSSIYISQADSLLFTVNAGDPYATQTSNTSSITVFSIGYNGALTKKAVTPVQGIFPNSLVYSNGYLYVSYYGQNTDRTLESFKVQTDGSLTSVLNFVASSNPAPQNVAPTNVLINPSKTSLVMISDNSNQIYTFPLNRNGTFGTPIITPPTFSPASATSYPDASSDVELIPFGGTFISNATGESLLVTSLNHDSLDYFTFNGATGELGRTNEVYSGYMDACWITTNPAQTFAYMAHGTPSDKGGGAITSYQIASNGQITQASEGKPAAKISGAAGEMWVDPTGTYLSLLDLEFAKVYTFRIQANGKLTQLSYASIGMGSESIFPEGLAGFVGSA
jgi:6-phosphogluconolactonase (cycloisomerase 2 family)